MIKHNIKAFIRIIVPLSILVYVIVDFVTQNFMDAVVWTISINGILWFIFGAWAWKWKIFYSWLVQMPNLSGDWVGLLKTDRNNEAKSIKAEINITQSFFHIQVKIKTNESKSRSIVASFNIDKERGLQQLIYTYQNEPDANISESEIHYGTTSLYFEEGFKIDKISGSYWTSRKTKGVIELTKKP